jgi:acyl-CoA reductase-like NAD-dependent aldehyde dehydrogenase
VLVDATADLQLAARRIVDSKAFDNSTLCTNESVLVVEDAVADRLLTQMQRHGAYLLDGAERDRVRELLFPGGAFDVRLVGKDARWIAEQAGVRVRAGTKILLAPFDLPVPEEPLAHEKLCPVLGVLRVASASRGIQAAGAVLRIGGAGHSAAIHSTDARTIVDFGAAVRVLRVSVNVGNSLGSSGMETNLAPTMTVGTGFFGGSSVGENLQPKHLVNWTRLAWNAEATVPMPDVTGIVPWEVPQGPVPAYPFASNAGERSDRPDPELPEPDALEVDELREEIRRLIVEELRQIIEG